MVHSRFYILKIEQFLKIIRVLLRPSRPRSTPKNIIVLNKPFIFKFANLGPHNFSRVFQFVCSQNQSNSLCSNLFSAFSIGDTQLHIMCMSRQLFKRARFYFLQNIKEFSMHASGAHLHCIQFCELVFAIQAKSSSSVNLVDDQLPLPLFSVCQLHYVNNTSGVVEDIKKVPLKLLPTINGFKLQVDVLVESISFKSLNELFHQQIPSRTNSLTCFNEMSNVLF